MSVDIQKLFNGVPLVAINKVQMSNDVVESPSHRMQFKQ